MSDPTFDFDDELIELSTSVDTSNGVVQVDLHKIGGGTRGRSYDGYWGYRVQRGPDQIIAVGGDLRTGTPKTHEQVVPIVLDCLGLEHTLRED